jgi:preprotein translocase subunit YajC
MVMEIMMMVLMVGHTAFLLLALNSPQKKREKKNS